MIKTLPVQPRRQGNFCALDAARRHSRRIRSKKIQPEKLLKSCVVRILVNLRWTSFLLSAFFITAAEAAPGDKMELVRDLAGRVGPVIGSALACPDVTRPRIQIGDREVCGGDPGCRRQRGPALRPRAIVRSQRRGRPQPGDDGTAGLQGGRTPARRSRTIAQPIRAGSGCCRSRRTGLRRGATACGQLRKSGQSSPRRIR